MLEHPDELCAGEIGVENEACPLVDFMFIAPCLELMADCG
jgi:hypothetical protein